LNIFLHLGVEALEVKQGQTEPVEGIEDPEEIRLILDRPHEGCLGQRLGPVRVHDSKAPEPVLPALGKNAANAQPVKRSRLLGVVTFKARTVLRHASKLDLPD
jgi:hypothetical protein